MTNLGRSVAVIAAAGAITATALAAPTAQATPTTHAHHHDSGLILTSPRRHLTVHIYGSGKQQWVDFNAGVYLKSAKHAFEFDVSRRHAKDMIRVVARAGDRTWRIPNRYLRGWAGLRKALVLTWRKPDGALIGRNRMNLCLNDYDEARLRPDAATNSAYTWGCGGNPFTRGQRWGIDRGWARSITPYGSIPGRLITTDTVLLDISLRRDLARALGMTVAQSTVRFHARVKHTDDGEGDAVSLERRVSPSALGNRSATADQAHPTEPADVDARSARVPRHTLPDLIALPAWGISTHHEGKHDLLDFAATVYNGGRGPLVAEGFRKGSKPVMRAYQFFYRGGRQVGSARVGTMKYDSRPSHQHWHFEDFAVYDLVKKKHKHAHALRTSGKEAFCLAPTDGIDLLVPGAPANPGNGDLSTACGDLSSIWVREVLANGWGDTYTQDRAGQSIDITTLPNGTYWIRVRANPGHRLYEARTTNNTSFRRVILGGTPGARTVRVPKYGRIDSERGLDVGGGED
ncbi:MAG TPA: lysyl oxidase family protein [Marmoricola sp.]